MLGSPAREFNLTQGIKGCKARSCKAAGPSPLLSTLPADRVQVPEGQEATESSKTPGWSPCSLHSPGKMHKTEAGWHSLSFLKKRNGNILRLPQTSEEGEKDESYFLSRGQHFSLYIFISLQFATIGKLKGWVFGKEEVFHSYNAIFVHTAFSE